MIDRKSWKEFKDSGLLWWINMTLHTFGWSIVLDYNGEGVVTSAYPARVEFRGFSDTSNEERYKKLIKYIKDNAEDLYKE